MFLQLTMHLKMPESSSNLKEEPVNKNLLGKTLTLFISMGALPSTSAKLGFHQYFCKTFHIKGVQNRSLRLVSKQLTIKQLVNSHTALQVTIMQNLINHSMGPVFQLPLSQP